MIRAGVDPVNADQSSNDGHRQNQYAASPGEMKRLFHFGTVGLSEIIRTLRCGANVQDAAPTAFKMSSKFCMGNGVKPESTAVWPNLFLLMNLCALGLVLR